MEAKFIRKKQNTERIEQGIQAYEPFVRTAFRVLDFKRSKEEKIEIILQEYRQLCDQDIEKNGLLISKLEELKAEIKSKKPELFNKFKECVKLLFACEIIDDYTKQELTDNINCEDQNDQVIDQNTNKKQIEQAESFFIDLIRKHRDEELLETKRDIVNTLLKEFSQINFGEMDTSILAQFQEYGSSSNGFHIQNSDYDISITTLEPTDERDLLKFFCKKAKTILDRICGENEFEIKQALGENIRVPVINIHIKKNHIQLGFTVNNKLALYNTELIKTYAMFEERFHILGLVVKIWSKVHKICSAKDGYLSSYAFLLMVINFLQTMKNPILPSLQSLNRNSSKTLIQRKGINNKVMRLHVNLGFETDSQVLETIKKNYSNNKMSEIMLLRKFFKFYSQPEKVENIRLSVKHAKHLERSDADWEKGLIYSIEDPFDVTHNPGSSLKKNTPAAEKTLTIMKKSYVLLKENKVEDVFNRFK